MPEEIEAPTEHLHEQINEEAEHGREGWTIWVALTTAFIAVLAAIGSLIANHHTEEALLSQLKASDQWSYYQAKGIKSELLITSDKLMAAMGKPVDAKDAAKVVENKKIQEETQTEARTLEGESKKDLSIAAIVARSVTIFQIAIAVSAISVLSKRKVLWYASILFALVGTGFLISGIFS